MTNGRTSSTVELGKGSPRGGVLPWMEADRYNLLGGFVEKQIGNLLIQSEYWVSHHNSLRDPASVLTVIENAAINSRQRENFLGINATKDNTLLTTEDVVTSASYKVQTVYVRLGYNINTKIGQFVPYVFGDWMSNPEVINNKTFGGDNESGFADNGVFFKPSLGVVYRPIESVAIKLDGSTHTQQFNGKQETYPEVRLDFSFAFK